MANERIKLFRIGSGRLTIEHVEESVNEFLEQLDGELVDLKLSTWGAADGGQIDRETTVLVIWRPIMVRMLPSLLVDAEQPHETALREMGETFAEIARAEADAR